MYVSIIKRVIISDDTAVNRGLDSNLIFVASVTNWVQKKKAAILRMFSEVMRTATANAEKVQGMFDYRRTLIWWN